MSTMYTQQRNYSWLQNVLFYGKIWLTHQWHINCLLKQYWIVIHNDTIWSRFSKAWINQFIKSHFGCHTGWISAANTILQMCRSVCSGPKWFYKSLNSKYNPLSNKFKLGASHWKCHNWCLYFHHHLNNSNIPRLNDARLFNASATAIITIPLAPIGRNYNNLALRDWPMPKSHVSDLNSVVSNRVVQCSSLITLMGTHEKSVSNHMANQLCHIIGQCILTNIGNIICMGILKNGQCINITDTGFQQNIKLFWN